MPKHARVRTELGWRWLAVALLLAIAFTGISVILGAHQRHQLSFDVQDEQGHYDYVVDMTHGHVPAWGDLYSQPTVRVLSCFSRRPTKGSPCAVAERNPRGYVPNGFSYEAQQPPLAYLPYVLVAEPNTSPRQALSAARWGGTIWTIAASGLLVGVGWVEGLTLLELTGLLSICLLSPVAVQAAATVTNDSAGVAAGALAILISSLARKRRQPMVTIGLLVGIFLGLLKGFFLVAPLVLLVAGLLLERQRLDRPRWVDLWRRNACNFCMFVGAGVAYLAWFLAQNARAIVPSSVVLHSLLGVRTTVRPQWSTIFDGFQDQLSMFVPIVSAPLYLMWNLTVYGTLAGLVFIRSSGHLASRLRSTAIAIFIGLGVLAVGYALLFYFEGHYNFNAVARFGLPVLPIIALVVVRAVRRVGLVTIGLVLPGSAALAQLLVGRF